MITALALAASLLAPSGVTATIQADPVCLPVTAQPGHSYPLTVYVQGGSLNLSVVPVTSGPAATLHQVPAAWVAFGANPAAPGAVAPGAVHFTLVVAPDAEPGAYESDIEVSAAPSAQPGDGAQAALGAAATTAFVFTVGPSATPPPPCDALDLAQSTGKFPAWPGPAFATSSWKQVFARERSARPAPEDTCPTATSGPAASAAPSYCPGAGSGPAAAPAYSPAASSSGSGKTHLPGWVWVAAIVAVLGLLMAKRRR